MTNYYHRLAQERGLADFGWLQSHHSFSFGAYHDPQHMGFSVLRVINDDTVVGGAGFSTHSHSNMEIISYVLTGSIQHRDSMGNAFTVPAGDVQRMSAGSGIQHSEYNASTSDELKFLQIWIEPNQNNIPPSYAQATIEQTEILTPLVTSDGRSGSISMQQDANLYRLRLNPNEPLIKIQIPENRCGYLHLITGAITVNSHSLSPGDAIGSQQPTTLTIQHIEDGVEALWFDLPATAA